MRKTARDYSELTRADSRESSRYVRIADGKRSGGIMCAFGGAAVGL